VQRNSSAAGAGEDGACVIGLLGYERVAGCAARSLLGRVADEERIADGERPRIYGRVFCSDARLLDKCRTGRSVLAGYAARDLLTNGQERNDTGRSRSRNGGNDADRSIAPLLLKELKEI